MILRSFKATSPQTHTHMGHYKQVMCKHTFQHKIKNKTSSPCPSRGNLCHLTNISPWRPLEFITCVAIIHGWKFIDELSISLLPREDAGIYAAELTWNDGSRRGAGLETLSRGGGGCTGKWRRDWCFLGNFTALDFQQRRRERARKEKKTTTNWCQIHTQNPRGKRSRPWPENLDKSEDSHSKLIHTSRWVNNVSSFSSESFRFSAQYEIQFTDSNYF